MNRLIFSGANCHSFYYAAADRYYHENRLSLCKYTHGAPVADNAGCERIFMINNVTREGIDELLEYLSDDLEPMTPGTGAV